MKNERTYFPLKQFGEHLERGDHSDLFEKIKLKKFDCTLYYYNKTFFRSTNY
jgi:hypothetical protein